MYNYQPCGQCFFCLINKSSSARFQARFSTVLWSSGFLLFGHSASLKSSACVLKSIVFYSEHRSKNSPGILTCTLMGVIERKFATRTGKHGRQERVSGVCLYSTEGLINVQYIDH